MTPDEVELLLTSIPEDEASQIGLLKRILIASQELWESKSADLDLIAQKIGDGSRQESWRTPLGESGLLDFFLGLIGTAELRPTLTVHILRIIGNSCAEKDENRQRVVASGCLPKIVTLLNDNSVLTFVIPVLFNICVDYEPAQVAVYKAGLNPELISLISGPRLANVSASMNLIGKLLEFMASQEPEANFVHPATPFTLLSLAAADTATDVDLDSFLGQCTVALTYLSHDQLQMTFLETPKAISLFFQVFEKLSDGFDVSQLEVEEEAQLKQVQSVFTQALADLSANSLFNSLCSLDGPETQTLQRWASTPRVPLQSAAWLALGNIARSDATCTHLVRASQIHKPLIATLSQPEPPADLQLLHAGLGFLKNLAIPAANKAVLGDAGLLDPRVLPRLWRLDTQPQIQFDAASLTRLLLVNCAANVRRVCAPLAAQGTDDAATSTQTTTLLHQLMDLHRRADQEPIKMETARAVASVCRVLHSAPTSPPSPSPSPSDTQSAPSPPPLPSLHDFYAIHDPDLPKTLLYLGTQRKFPALRSELWFVLALMARSASGAAVVARALQSESETGSESESEIVGVLVEAVAGEDEEDSRKEAAVVRTAKSSTEPEQEGEGEGEGTTATAIDNGSSSGGGLEPRQVDPSSSSRTAAMTTRVDRENGLVLVAELLGRCPDALLPSTRTTFSRILRTGGQMVLGAREEGE
ncbi:armadillo-type protein [Xylariaceae sp. FL0662B]|nr:armadillo-type protein [Xylariaceae sp. FL0662B]